MTLLDRDTERFRCRHFWEILPQLLLLCGLVAIIQPVQAGVSGGIAWLSVQQDADGGYAEPADVASPFQSTAEVLRTLNFLGEAGQSSGVDALNFLQAETYRNTEILARLIVVTAASGSDTTDLVADILLHQGSDGGFGELYGYDSSVLDTAFALEALATVHHPLDQSISDAVLFLLSHQQSDGGWLDGQNESSVYITALAMQALQPYQADFPGLDSALVAAKRYLLSSQVSMGLWGETFESALAVMALINAANEFSEVEALVNELRSQQRADGSWDGSPYSTALALRALASQPIPHPTEPVSGDISGLVLNATTRQPIEGALIEIGSGAESARSDLSGNFAVEGLEPGEKTIRISAPGYAGKTIAGTVEAGKVLGLGNITLTLLPTVSALQGVIVNAQTGLPVEGALVSVTGSTSASAITGLDGSYAIGGLSPGNVSLAVTKADFLTVTGNGLLIAGSTVIFSPVLLPANISEEPAEIMTGTGTVQGKVVDKVTGEVIDDVAIAISGSATATGSTNPDGSYSFANLPPGNITITLSKSGYVSAATTASIVADRVLKFNPKLTPENVLEPENGAIAGMIVDLATQAPLPGVIITIAGGAETRVIASSSSGSFRAERLPAGSYTVSFAKEGYENRMIENVVVNDGGGMDLQTIALEKILNDVTLVGRLTDSENGMPVANATIAVRDTSIRARTDDAGRYRVEGLGVGIKTLIISATGYSTQSLIFDFPQGGVYELNRTLNQSQLSVLSFTTFGVEQSSYPAYADVRLYATARNDSALPIDALVEYTILDDQDRVVDVIHGAWANSEGQEERTYRFEPGVEVPLSAVWNTRAAKPGTYRVIARILVGDVMVGPSIISLAERVTRFAIEPTESIPKLSVTPLPGFSGVGRAEQILYRVDVVNRSNVDTSVVLNYRLLAPEGWRVDPGNTKEILLKLEEDNKSIVFVSDTVTFSRAGEYNVAARVLTGTVPSEIIEGVIVVAPGIRIQPSQNVSPATVTPDEDKRIRINIRLEGVELR